MAKNLHNRKITSIRRFISTIKVEKNICFQCNKYTPIIDIIQEYNEMFYGI